MPIPLGPNTLRRRFIESGGFDYAFGTADVFHRGLGGLFLKPPGTGLRVMQQEHCGPHEHVALQDVEQGGGSVLVPEAFAIFKGSNFGIHTNSSTEFWFVYDPDSWLQAPGAGEAANNDAARIRSASASGVDVRALLRESRKPLAELYEEWPHEAAQLRPETPRRPRSLDTFRAAIEEKNALLMSVGSTGLLDAEFIAARLYTGPMFDKYNASLRGGWPGASAFDAKRWRDLCGQNTYAATIHLLNSSLIKLSRLTARIDQPVYRGLAGGVLPKCFWKADENGFCGGVDYGIMSFSANQRTALEYARATGGEGEQQASARSTLLEMNQGLADRGAEISWLSQYPTEREVCFPACTGLQVTAKKVKPKYPSLLVVEVRPSVSRLMRRPPAGDVSTAMDAKCLQVLRPLGRSSACGGCAGGMSSVDESAVKSD